MKRGSAIVQNNKIERKVWIMTQEGASGYRH